MDFRVKRRLHLLSHSKIFMEGENDKKVTVGLKLGYPVPVVGPNLRIFLKVMAIPGLFGMPEWPADKSAGAGTFPITF
jgi:hypothetical protein